MSEKIKVKNEKFLGRHFYTFINSNFCNLFIFK